MFFDATLYKLVSIYFVQKYNNLIEYINQYDNRFDEVI